MNSCNDIGRCRQGSNGSACCCQLHTATATPLITANSDGSDPDRDSIDDYLDDTGLLLLQAIALLVAMVSLMVWASL